MQPEIDYVKIGQRIRAARLERVIAKLIWVRWLVARTII